MNKALMRLSTLWCDIRCSKLLGMALLGLSIFHLIMQLAILLPRQMARTDYNRDVAVYYFAARNAYHGNPVYQQQPDFGPDQRPTGAYLYAPPVAAVSAPLGALSFLTYTRLTIVINLLAFWVFVWCLACLSGKPSVRRVLICGLLAGLFPDTNGGIWLGQLDPVLWMLFALGLVFWSKTFFWIVAAIAKPFYAWPVIVYSVARRGDIWERINDARLRLWWIFIISIAIVVLGGVVCGWGSYGVWLRDVLPTMSQGNFSLANVSLPFGVLRALRWANIWHYPGGALATLPHLWLIGASFAGPAIVWWLVRRVDLRLRCAIVTIAAALFAPVCWMTYLPLSLPMFALLLQDKAIKVLSGTEENIPASLGAID